MISIFRNIAPFILIPLMLFSSIGFSIDIHYCNDEIKSIGIIEATPCAMEQGSSNDKAILNLPPCHLKKLKANQESPEKNGYNRGNCCHNERFFFSKSAEHNSSFAIEYESTGVTAVIIYACLNYKLICEDLPTVYYKHYHPPLLFVDIPVLQQVFRI